MPQKEKMWYETYSRTSDGLKSQGKEAAAFLTYFYLLSKQFPSESNLINEKIFGR